MCYSTWKHFSPQKKKGAQANKNKKGSKYRKKARKTVVNTGALVPPNMKRNSKEFSYSAFDSIFDCFSMEHS